MVVAVAFGSVASLDGVADVEERGVRLSVEGAGEAAEVKVVVVVVVLANVELTENCFVSSSMFTSLLTSLLSTQGSDMDGD